MKQNYLTSLLTLLLSIIGIQAYAHDFEAVNSDGVTIYYKFINSNSELSVTFRGDLATSDQSKYRDRYTGYVVIPESVTYEGKTYPVTEIGYDSFCYCKGLTAVTIPNSVIRIENSAFGFCEGLTAIDIPNSVTEIKDEAFAYTSLTSFTLPANVTRIVYDAFRGCDSLAVITVAEGNPVYDSRENCNAIIKTETNELILGCKNSVIPNTVTSLGICAFIGCHLLASITIPGSVTSLGVEAFGDCHALTSITIPGSVTTIGNWAMYGSENLASVHLIGNDALTIGENFLRGCRKLTDVYYYKEKLPTIGDYAFHGVNLEDVTLHVPAAAVDAFKATAPWSGFKAVVALTDEDAAVNGITAQPAASERYRLDGQRIASPRKGVNIVKKGDKAVKVVVR